jgi:hypothetical protein
MYPDDQEIQRLNTLSEAELKKLEKTMKAEKRAIKKQGFAWREGHLEGGRGGRTTPWPFLKT